MLKNGVTKMGIAASYAPNTKYKVFWTLVSCIIRAAMDFSVMCRFGPAD